ncbi:MAG: YdeI/OmpD-associated family protein [Acidimicrobiales bacterium]|nr:YdeI/OmpD-associated family protein [Acidimicrobiales bacterium]
MEKYPDVDAYLAASQQWPDEIAALRPILVDTGLDEAIKWGKPCYSHGDANIVIVQEMKDFLALLFTKGALLDDPDGVLEPQGPNTRSAMRICFRSVDEVTDRAPTIAAYVENAIAVEDAGLEVGPAPEPDWVEELRERMADDDAFRQAFDALTPGRRREYNMHFSDAKKPETRMKRIEKYAPKILAGKGMRDR